MTTYIDPDGWILVEDRSREPGSGFAIDHRNRYVGHPVDVYRRRCPGWTGQLSDLEILELWYVEEVDRRLNEVGLHATPRTTWARLMPAENTITPENLIRLKARFLYGRAVHSPGAFLHVAGEGL